MINTRRTYNWYQKSVEFILIIFSISYIFRLQNYNTLSLRIITPILLIVLGTLYDLSHFNKTSQFAYLIFLWLLLFIFSFKLTISTIIGFAIAFMLIPIPTVIKTYKWVFGTQLLAGLILSVIGIFPMYNGITGKLTLGLSNENTLGLLLSLFFICSIIKINNQNLSITHNKIIYPFLLLILLINLVILENETANAVLLIFFITYIIFKIKNNRILNILSIISGFIPILICIFSIYVGWNYTPTSNFLYNLNFKLTDRLYSWNYYFNFYGIQLLPQKDQITNPNIVRGNLDGFYAYCAIFFGILFLVLITVGLALCNYRLARSRNYIILALMIAFEFVGFTETVLLSPNYNFAIFFALLAFYPSWLNENL